MGVSVIPASSQLVIHFDCCEMLSLFTGLRRWDGLFTKSQRTIPFAHRNTKFLPERRLFYVPNGCVQKFLWPQMNYSDLMWLVDLISTPSAVVLSTAPEKQHEVMDLKLLKKDLGGFRSFSRRLMILSVMPQTHLGQVLSWRGG